MKELYVKVLETIYYCGGITLEGITKLGGTADDVKTMLTTGILHKFPVEVKGKRIAIFHCTEKGKKEYEKHKGLVDFAEVDDKKAVILSNYYINRLSDTATDFENNQECIKTKGLNADLIYYIDGMKCAVIIVRPEIKTDIQSRTTNFVKENEIEQMVVLVR